jgi:hypothetical protein
MVRSPAALASCSAHIETPPVPRSSTVLPGLAAPPTKRAFHAVTPAHGSVAASVNSSQEGTEISTFSGTTISSASMPSMVAPGTL